MDCNIGLMLKDYVKPIMQLLTNDIRDYNMRLLTTKCLNTAVMISFFLLGREKGIKVADYCDSHNTAKRHTEYNTTNYKSLNEKLVKSLMVDLLKPIATREMFYILMTDNYFPFDDPEKEKAFFCGHVFVIEKVTKGPIPVFYFYQSYINEYDLNGKDSIKKMSYRQTESMLKKLEYVVMNEYWDATTVKYWLDITHVDTSKLKGSKSKGKIHLCYKKAKVRTCLGNLKKYTDQKIKEIKNHAADPDAIYGDRALYDDRVQPLKVGEMMTTLNNLSRIIK